jgi:beta-glucosidase
MIMREPTQTAKATGSAAFGILETQEPLTNGQIEGITRELLAQLSLDEKIGMMSGDTSFFQGYLDGSRGGYRRHPLNTAGAITCLGIPGVIFSDGPRGVMLPGATTFPQGSARGASWDPNLEERIGNAMGREARAHGANMIGAPCINLLRHPAWGRARKVTVRTVTTWARWVRRLCAASSAM